MSVWKPLKALTYLRYRWQPPAGPHPLGWTMVAAAPSWWRKAIPQEPQVLPAPMPRIRALRVAPNAYGIAFITFTFLTGMAPLGQNHALAWSWTFFAWATIAAVLIRTQSGLYGIRLVRAEATPVFAGGETEVFTTFDSPRGARKGLIVEPLTDEDIESRLTIEKGKQGTARFKVPAPTRGRFQFGPLRVRTSQPMGMATALGFLWPKATFVVYPAPENEAPPLPRVKPQDRPQTAQPASTGLPSPEADLLRPYRIGDSARHILWKSSARHRHLMVRDAPHQPPGTVALRWVDVDELPRERAVARLTRWVLDADTDGGPYLLDLDAQGPCLGPASGPAHRDACLTALAEVAT